NYTSTSEDSALEKEVTQATDISEAPREDALMSSIRNVLSASNSETVESCASIANNTDTAPKNSLFQTLKSTLGDNIDMKVYQQAILEIKEILNSSFITVEQFQKIKSKIGCFDDPNFLAPVFQPDVYSYISKDRFTSADGYLFRASDLLLQLTAFLSTYVGTSSETSESLFTVSSLKSAVDLISQARMILAVRAINPKLKCPLIHHSPSVTTIHSDGLKRFILLDNEDQSKLLASQRGNATLNQLANKRPYSRISQESISSLYGSPSIQPPNVPTPQESQQVNGLVTPVDKILQRNVDILSYKDGVKNRS
uniref:Coiled-coil domain-containing protein n=1 Tax=Strongyloides papillosus TaxID=174720 RepID=A0A0N5CIH8_STREA